ncbi:hypothetical protein U1Q18_029370 [Sarracenia purpurea var. burkii]
MSKNISKITLKFCHITTLIYSASLLTFPYKTSGLRTIGNELQDPSRIKSVVQASLALCSTVYAATSFLGFLLFGGSTHDNMLANFDSNLGIPYSSLLIDCVGVSNALHLVLVFPVIFHPLRIHLDGLFFPSAGPLVSDNFRFTLVSARLISVLSTWEPISYPAFGMLSSSPEQQPQFVLGSFSPPQLF